MKKVDIIHSFAGVMIIASLMLTKFHNPNWFYLTLFVGINLFQFGFTKFCPLDKFLDKVMKPENR